ncbi:Bax inhibitor-1/YccA family protein [Luteipulveratus sp. YIM 133132]|uniref:Bax inhibitor-1/YccA family protein n=1 Tax=Luteipulveratus flavus TaxID=3031728 RepID=UPI0023B181FD|nr:Bax inhibitor-1/YccA family protein [Luteipulveratus sp. YIM 133132]MDE9364347.1 Bax inhibitor-1/YccA family protein [Luteipulveratus sp. YIM 133132]
MASNPVFNRFEKDLSEGRYAGFGQRGQQSPQDDRPGMPAQPQWGQPGPQQQTGTAGAWGAGQQQLSNEQLEQMYSAGTATPQQTGRMTLDDVVMKTLGLFALVVVVGAGAWAVAAQSQSAGTGLWGVGLVGTLVLGLVIAFKKTISVPLIVLYAALEGLFVGAISQAFESAWPGVVPQAVVATACVFAGMFAGWKFGIIKVTERSRRIFGFALIGYVLFALVNLVLTMVGVFPSPFGAGGSGWLGIGISIFAIGLASYSLAIDFDTIDRGVQAGLPEKYSWLMAHGLIVSVVWLYLEILRLLARLRD